MSDLPNRMALRGLASLSYVDRIFVEGMLPALERRGRSKRRGTAYAAAHEALVYLLETLAEQQENPVVGKQWISGDYAELLVLTETALRHKYGWLGQPESLAMDASVQIDRLSTEIAQRAAAIDLGRPAASDARGVLR